MNLWSKLNKNLQQEIPNQLKPWLSNAYILSKHLKANCQQWSLQRLSESMQPLNQANQTRLNTTDKQAWQREIHHCEQGKPIIFAQLIVPQSTYQALEQELGDLQENPIGETLLYHNPEVWRSHFEYKKITRDDIDFAHAFDDLSIPSNSLWARRSVFYWRGLPLLITEVFSDAMPTYQKVSGATTGAYRLMSKLRDYIQLTRFHRPLPILLIIWPTLWALWIANKGTPEIKYLLVFIIGAILMRAAGCVFNDITDRQVDGFIERTKMRPLATGRIRTRAAVVFGCLLSFIAFLLVILFLNRLSIILAIIGLILACIYPLMKRITHLPQVVLGIAFNWGVIMAFAAIQNKVPTMAWGILIIALIWTVAYDTIYALADIQDDQKIGIKSTAVLFGRHNTLAIASLQVLSLVGFILLGAHQHFNSRYFVCLLGVIALFAYQHYLIRERTIANCIRAFSNNHWIGLLIFIALFSQYSLGN